MSLTFAKGHSDFDTPICCLGKTAEEAHAKVDEIVQEDPSIEKART